MVKPTYKFVVDGVGVDFASAQRNNIDVGVNYQKKQMLDYWVSRKDFGYVLIFQRDIFGHFTNFPFKVFQINKSGESIEISLDDWRDKAKINYRT